MEKKSKKHFLLNLFTKFSIKGDVVNGDKYVFKMPPSLKEDLLKIINKNDENYSDFYKNYISKFEELDNYAFSLFYPNLIKEEFSVKSKPLILGKKIINWIYGLEKFPTKDIEEFYKLIKVEFKFSNDTAIVKRWNANIAYFNNDLKRASDNYSKLYDDLKDVDSIPKWYIDDICIDGRNILHQYGNTQNTHYYNNKYQDKISSNPHKLSYPDVDRIKINIYENVSKHIFNNKNKAKYTIIYGAGLEEIFKEIQNLVYLTIFYGSITHLKLIRELISDIMYMYAETFEDEQFYKLSLKMLFISGKYKEFRNLYNKLKLNYSFVNSEEFIKDILNSRKSLFGFEINRNSIFLFDIYGRYLDDNVFKKLENELFEIVTINSNFQIDLISNAFKAIAANLIRSTNIGSLLKIMKKYFFKSYSSFYIDFGGIIKAVDVNNLSSSEFSNFKFIIDSLIKEKSHLNYDLSDQIIAIKKRNPKITKYDELIRTNGTLENFKYEAEKDNNYVEMAKKVIKIFKDEHEVIEKRCSGVYYDKFLEYRLGNKIFQKDLYSETREFIINDYLPLAKSIIKSEKEIIYEKIKHIKYLSYFLMIEKDSEIVDEVIKDIHAVEFTKFNDVSTFGGVKDRDIYDLKINIIMCDVICNKIKYSDGLIKYLEIAINRNENLEEIVNCILILNDYCILNKDDIQNLYLLFKICYNVNDIDVRNKIVEISNCFIKTFYQEEVLEILNERSKYLSEDECIGYIKLITSVNDKTIFDASIENLKNNRNFYIKYMVDKYLKD